MTVYAFELEPLDVSYKIDDKERLCTFQLHEVGFTVSTKELSRWTAQTVYEYLCDLRQDQTGTGPSTMLETLIKLYTTSMKLDVRSPIPHLAGPPGTNKSGACQQLADLVGVTLHTVNVSRMTPLEIEGIQMPVDGNTKLQLLLNTMWSDLKDGDIILFDEFLRGFPEVYNGLLDIFTSRRVAGYDLPKVFIVAASNSIATYDPALEDRLMHLFVPDIRTRANERYRVQQILVESIGLMPEMAKTQEMAVLFEKTVEPTYAVLDQFKKTAAIGTVASGKSVRNLVGQAQLREVQDPFLRDLIDENNRLAKSKGKEQYVVLLSGRVDDKLEERLRKLVGNSRLTEIQAANLDLNIQLIEMHKEKTKGNPVKSTQTGEEDGIDFDIA